MSRPWAGLAGLLVGMATSVLMQTLVATALPTVVAELGGLTLYAWVFGAYMLASTVTLPLFGKVADRFGRRVTYLGGLVVFVAGAALAGLSRSMEQLIAFRVLQGLGAGALAPAAFALIADLFDEDRRARVLGVFGATHVLASMIGPLAGGVVTDHLGWRWAFFLVVPVGALSWGLARAGLPAAPAASTQPRPARAHPLDWQGAALLAVALCAALIGLKAAVGPQGAYAWGGRLAVLLAAGLFAVAFRWERRHPDPVFPLRRLARTSLRDAALGALLLGCVTHASIAFLPLLLHGRVAATASGTGAALVPMLLASGVGSALSGRWMARRRTLTLVSWAQLAVGFLWLMVAGREGGFVATLAPTLLLGAGTGLLFPVLIDSAASAGGETDRATATGLIQLARNVGGAAGVPLLGLGLGAGQLPASAVSGAFAALAALSVVGLLAALTFPAHVEELA